MIEMNSWYMAMSNHQSWADIFILLAVANHKLPLTKILYEERTGIWIPFRILSQQNS